MRGATSLPKKGKTMKRAIVFGVAALTAFGFAPLGCSYESSVSGGSGGASGGASGGSGGAASGGASGGSSTTATGGGSGGANGGSSTTATGGGSGGSTTSSGSCGTTDGTYEENTTFGTDGTTDPYKLNKWGTTWGNGTEPSLTQTTTGPDGLDCSSGCAKLTIDFSGGTTQYSAGAIVEYFGTADDSVENLLNETITAKIAIGVEQANGADKAVPIDINLFGQDTFASTTGVDNEWVKSLGTATSLAAADGWHTVTFKVVDAEVPSWAPARTVCASGLHAIGIAIQNNAVIDGTNGAVVTLYIQSISVGNGSSSGSGGSGGGSGGSAGGSGGGGGEGGGGEGGGSGGGGEGGGSGGEGGGGDGGASGGSGGDGGSSSGGATGGTTSTSSSGGSTGSCGTDDGTYEENTTFGTDGKTDPYKVNAWGTWGNATEPAVTQTTTGPDGLDCSSGCAKLTIDFSDGTAQYSAGSFVEYFGTGADSVENLLNETITAKVAVGVEQASGADTDVPISINLFGQDTYESSSGTDNAWVKDLGSAASLAAADGWHDVTFKVVDAEVPSWDGTNGAVVSLYVQSFAVSPP
jgi:hypothetical protein